MAEYKVVMPKMGESIIEATILSWHKKEGDTIAENEILLEVATDKVDSDVPSPVSGTIKRILFKPNDIIPIGEALAIIETDTNVSVSTPNPETEQTEQVQKTIENQAKEEVPIVEEKNEIKATIPTQEVISIEQKNIQLPKPKEAIQYSNNYSPLVLNISKQEGISATELDSIIGSGLGGRVTKEDILAYAEQKKKGNIQTISTSSIEKVNEVTTKIAPKIVLGDEIVEMDRMRKLIAKNMVASKQISAHVSSFVEVDVSKIVRWRAKNKEIFKQKYGFNLTYLPVFIEAIAQAIKEFPDIHISVDGDNIIYKKQINIGIATALPNGNLIVPVIKSTDQKNILGIAQEINLLANKARTNSLTIYDISGGTYSVSNIGTFGNIIGTPIIPQPQVAIMAVGVVTKKPVVVELEDEDIIAIRSMMYLSHTYDHRVVDGMLGGKFVKRVATILENFDETQAI